MVYPKQRAGAIPGDVAAIVHARHTSRRCIACRLQHSLRSWKGTPIRGWSWLAVHTISLHSSHREGSRPHRHGHGVPHEFGSFQFRAGSAGTFGLVCRDAVLYMKRPGTSVFPLEGVSAGRHVRL